MTSIINKTPALFAALLLSACGGSDDSSSGTGYIQFYNASANAPKVFLEIDDAVRTGANFGNVTTRHSYNNENYELDYQYLNDNNDYVSVFDNTEVLTIENDEKTLKVLSGDFSNPQIHSFQIPEFDEEDEFKIGIINTISDSTEYDVYVAKEGYDFVDAELVQSTNYLALNDLETIKEESYHFYVTEQGSQTPVFHARPALGPSGTVIVLLRRRCFLYTDWPVLLRRRCLLCTERSVLLHRRCVLCMESCVLLCRCCLLCTAKPALLHRHAVCAQKTLSCCTDIVCYNCKQRASLKLA